jgi:hypothetical protein
MGTYIATVQPYEYGVDAGGKTEATLFEWS